MEELTLNMPFNLNFNSIFLALLRPGKPTKRDKEDSGLKEVVEKGTDLLYRSRISRHYSRLLFIWLLLCQHICRNSITRYMKNVHIPFVVSVFFLRIMKAISLCSYD